ncbi:Na/Pi cotransporter family protein [Caldichromatium japonicum]|uniref:Na/Pi cotransporter family protein n=1 Tax=Caldichromatium japonicum TaxID=2699430 RepID=A0A6G7VAX6_9GAMM|nr:Na/Pi cotransporter family protein [Caldichromatium japonicum]QIK37016.1 Na/Pi cotransporter family protein [Caldichromatium japonicum]
MPAQEQALAWWPMSLGLLGGLALFLYGLEQMTTALKAVAGERLHTLLQRLTTHPLLGALSGALITAILNSSSVTTVLAVGFVSAGLMSLPQAIGVILGANVGSTFTAQLIAFRLENLAYLLIALGFGLSLDPWRESVQHGGSLILGLGLVFFGLDLMSDSMAPLRNDADVIALLTKLSQPALAILVATLFTALIQSSAATLGIIITLGSQGLIGLETGIALVFGANIGTCVTALLAAIGKPRIAQRAALVHVIFNVAGVLIWIAWIDPLAYWIQWLSPARPDLPGTARLAAELPRQIANAHTLFNLANTLLFIGLTRQIARLVEWLIPDTEHVPLTDPGRAHYLDDSLMATADLALDRARLEILRMGEQVSEMMQRIMPAILAGDRQALVEIERMDNAVDRLHAAIIGYLGKISRQNLTERQTRVLMALLATVNDLENIGDLIETNLVTLGRERLTQGVAISTPTRELLIGFHRVVSRAFGSALQAVSQRNPQAAQTVIDLKVEIQLIAASAAAHEARRLVASEPNRIPAYTLEVEIIEKLQRIYHFARRIAKNAVNGTPLAHPVTNP